MINQNLHQQATKQITLSMSYTLTFICKKSVSLSFSSTTSKTFLLSYFENEKTYSYALSQTDVARLFPYIIRYYSPSFLITEIKMILTNNNKKISPEQLIGVVC